MLGPAQAFGIVVGGVIGASVFLVPSVVAQHVPSIGAIFLLWILGAAITLAGVLTLAELAAMMPQAGGGYVYINAAFGPLIGFLFSWTDALLVRAGAAATISYTFALYFVRLFGVPGSIAPQTWQGLVAIILVLLLLALNYRGASWGANVQVAGTAAKLAAVGAAVILPLLLWRGPNGLTSAPLWPAGPVAGGLVAALVPVLWTYGGWDQLAHLAEEVKDPSRNLPRILTAGMLTVAACYLAVVFGIHYVLPLKTVASSEVVGATLFEALLGAAGVTVISVVILVSALVSANGAILSGPRACFALARQGDAPAWLAKTHPRFETPSNAILLVGLWSASLIAVSLVLLRLSPSQQRPLFEVLISYVMFGYLFFQGLIALSAIVLRREHPELDRPFRVPLHPLLPVASVASTVLLMGALAWNSPVEAAASAVIVGAGIPVALLFRRSLPVR